MIWSLVYIFYTITSEKCFARFYESFYELIKNLNVDIFFTNLIYEYSLPLFICVERIYHFPVYLFFF